MVESFFGQPSHDTTPNKNSASKQVNKISSNVTPVHAPSPTPVPNVTATPTRKSKRNALSADQDSTEKVAKLKARKNLEETDKQGNEHPDSFIYFPDEVVIKNISHVGISLGSSVSKTSKSIRNLKNIELDRIHAPPVLNSSIEKIASPVDCGGFTDDEINILALNQFCGEVVKGLSEGYGSDLCDL